MGALLLSAAYSGLIDPRWWAFPAVLGLAFPFLLAGEFLLAVACLLLRQWKSLVLVAATLALAWPVVTLNVPLSGSRDSDEKSTTFRVLTYNVAGFDMEARALRYILNQDVDFVLLQETSLGPVDFTDLPQHVELRDELEQKYPYHSTGYHDLTILSKLPYTVYNDTTLRQGFGSPDDINSEYHFYAKAFDLRVAGQPLRIVNVHLQSIGLDSHDKELYRKLTSNELQGRDDMAQVRASLLAKLKGAFRRRAGEAQQLREILNDTVMAANVIVCGDFNDTPASYSYRTVRGGDLRDAFAECGRWPTFTYNRDRLYFKIDHILYRGNMRAVDYRCDRTGGSDHYPQVVTFALSTGQ